MEADYCMEIERLKEMNCSKCFSNRSYSKCLWNHNSKMFAFHHSSGTYAEQTCDRSTCWENCNEGWGERSRTSSSTYINRTMFTFWVLLSGLRAEWGWDTEIFHPSWVIKLFGWDRWNFYIYSHFRVYNPSDNKKGPLTLYRKNFKIWQLWYLHKDCVVNYIRRYLMGPLQVYMMECIVMRKLVSIDYWSFRVVR